MLVCQPVQATSKYRAGSTVQQYEGQKSKERTMKRLTEEKRRPPTLKEREITELPGGTNKVYVGKIVLQKDRDAKKLLKDYNLTEAIEGYEGKGLSFSDMNTLVGGINEEITNKGIVAYIPKQPFDDGMMYINIISKDSKK